MRRLLFLHKAPAALAMALVATSFAVSPAGAQMAVPSVGVIQDVPGATDRPDPSLTYKLAFDITSMPSSADAISPALTGIARMVNTLRAHGVPANRIQATAVFHGLPIALVTKDETYRNRTGGKGNPNIDLIRQLAAAGVKFAVCGGSARAQNYQASDLLPGVTLNLSAPMTFIDLQTRGYVKVDM